MKTGGARGLFIKPLVEALERAGYELSRRGTSHFHFTCPNRPRITVPSKLDDVHLARRLARTAGVTLDA